MSKELDARLAALIERCDETDRLIMDTRRFADLEDENARLRSCLSDDAENARMIMDENAKLRELVRDMYAVMVEDAANCDVTYPEQFDYRVLELGVEVDDA